MGAIIQLQKVYKCTSVECERRNKNDTKENDNGIDRADTRGGCCFFTTSLYNNRKTFARQEMIYNVNL